MLGTAVPTSGVGVRGITTSGTGVHGAASGTTGITYGVSGEAASTGGTGVSGFASAGSGTTAGVTGTANSPGGYGTVGWNTTGTGVFAVSNHTQIRLGGESFPPPEAGLARTQGELSFDLNRDLWFCVEPGNPGTWRRLAGPATAGAFMQLATPKRVYDSRPGQAPVGVGPKTPLAANTARTIDLKANSSGIPAGATAVLVSLVATGTTTGIGGFMTIYRNGIAWPGTSNLNWSGPGQTVAVTTTTAVDDQARCNLYAGSVTDVVVDVLGYYR